MQECFPNVARVLFSVVMAATVSGIRAGNGAAAIPEWLRVSGGATEPSGSLDTKTKPVASPLKASAVPPDISDDPDQTVDWEGKDLPTVEPVTEERRVHTPAPVRSSTPEMAATTTPVFVVLDKLQCTGEVEKAVAASLADPNVDEMVEALVTKQPDPAPATEVIVEKPADPTLRMYTKTNATPGKKRIEPDTARKCTSVSKAKKPSTDQGTRKPSSRTVVLKDGKDSSVPKPSSTASIPKAIPDVIMDSSAQEGDIVSASSGSKGPSQSGSSKDTTNVEPTNPPASTSSVASAQESKKPDSPASTGAVHQSLGQRVMSLRRQRLRSRAPCKPVCPGLGFRPARQQQRYSSNRQCRHYRHRRSHQCRLLFRKE